MSERVTQSNDQWDSCHAAMDPRTSRFGLMKLTSGNNSSPSIRVWNWPPYGADPGTPTRASSATKVGFNNGSIDMAKGITVPLRSGEHDGATFMIPEGVFPTSMGWNPGSVSYTTAGHFVAYNNLGLGAYTGNHICHPRLFSQNNPFARRDNQPWGDSGDSIGSDFVPPSGGSNATQSYSDPDGVVRRATGGLVPYASNGPAATTDVGLPMTPATTGNNARLSQSDSRPVILNRPFRTVAELGYTFSGTPWKNLNFSMPESVDSAMLDVFCISDTDDPNALVAGRVNLNTRQAPVVAGDSRRRL